VYWEGEQAVEECTDEDDTAVVQRRMAVMKTRPAQQSDEGKRSPALVDALKLGAEESEEADDSEDDYVDENEGGHKKVRLFLSAIYSSADMAFFNLASTPYPTLVHRDVEFRLRCRLCRR
jgi:hypothetical protein